MKFLKLLFSLLIIMTTLSCFSAKGLPIKEVKDEAPVEEQVSDNTNEASNEADMDTVAVEDAMTIDDEKTTTIVDHSSWDALLQKHVAENGDVDYKGFKADSTILNDYVNFLASKVPTEDWSINEQLAYFINVYNANTIKLIIDNYPTKSIKDIKNPWLKDRLMIGTTAYSLADIENGILRKMNEPRIHFAINCASYSCPKLLNTAYTANNVQDLMERATKEFINNSSKNTLTVNDVKLSEIFKWYKGDFTENGSLIDYINQYADIKISANAKVGYLSYDWSLNEIN